MGEAYNVIYALNAIRQQSYEIQKRPPMRFSPPYRYAPRIVMRRAAEGALALLRSPNRSARRPGPPQIPRGGSGVRGRACFPLGFSASAPPPARRAAPRAAPCLRRIPRGMDQFGRGKAPRTRVCHVCGRQYGLSSFHIHLKQCVKLWEERESKKPPGQRRPVPPDPADALGVAAAGPDPRGAAHGGARGGHESQSFDQADARAMQDRLDAVNAAAQQSFNSVAMVQCEHCGRTFMEERLAKHQASCTADNPMRRVGSVRAGKAPVDVSSASGRSRSPPAQRGRHRRPHTSIGIRGRPSGERRAAPAAAPEPLAAGSTSFPQVAKHARGASEGERTCLLERASEDGSLDATAQPPAYDATSLGAGVPGAALLAKLEARCDALERSLLSSVKELRELRAAMRGGLQAGL